MNLKKHINFLKIIFIYTVTAFGGPQGHYGMMLKIFVDKYKYITKEELIDLNSFCQLLPGASSTQLLTIIAYKRGGLFLSVITFLIWILPACLIMTLLSLYISHFHILNINNSIFKFIQPIAIGFLLYAAIHTYKVCINNKNTFIVMLMGLLLTVYFFKNPWIIPILFLFGAIISNFYNRSFPKVENKKHKYKFQPLFIIIFLITFTFLAFLSETARKNNWNHRKLYNVGENYFRFGSIVFGGGDILLPMIIDQYVARPTNKKIILKNPGIIKINQEYLLTGYGLTKAIPGPVFSYAAFTGGLALEKEGKVKQITASIIASIAIFLPSILLVLFFFPLWNNLKNYVVVHRSLIGINAVIVGIMFAAFFYVIKDYFSTQISSQIITYFLITLTYILLTFTKIPSPFLVILALFLGIIF